MYAYNINVDPAFLQYIYYEIVQRTDKKTAMIAVKFVWCIFPQRKATQIFGIDDSGSRMRRYHGVE